MGTLKYCNREYIDNEEYISFLKNAFGNEKMDVRYQRMKWYFQNYDFHLLLAFDGQKVVGQSCALKDIMYLRNNCDEMYWSVDTYVLKEMRGQKIGFLLQKKLHDDFNSFSSASYSRPNGNIKMKLGEKVLLSYNVHFYPINIFFSVINEYVCKKIFKCKLNLTKFVPNHKLYFYLNRININGLECSYNMDLANIKGLESFIETALSRFEWHCNKSLYQLRTKYLHNPSIKVNNLVLRKAGKLVAMCIFSDVYKRNFLQSELYYCKILEMFVIDRDKRISKSVMSLIINYFSTKGVRLDGITSINAMTYWPSIKYKWDLLSSFSGQKIDSFYLSYGDQDMEQML